MRLVLQWCQHCWMVHTPVHTPCQCLTMATSVALQADVLMLRKSLPGDAATQYTCIVDTAVYSRCAARVQLLSSVHRGASCR